MSTGRARRRKEVERIRNEGRLAFESGRSIHANPYDCMDAYQWANGYADACAERVLEA